MRKEEEEFPDWIREVKTEYSLFTFSLILIKNENAYALLQESQYSTSSGSIHKLEDIGNTLLF